MAVAVHMLRRRHRIRLPMLSISTVSAMRSAQRDRGRLRGLRNAHRLEEREARIDGCAAEARSRHGALPVSYVYNSAEPSVVTRSPRLLRSPIRLSKPHGIELSVRPAQASERLALGCCSSLPFNASIEECSIRLCLVKGPVLDPLPFVEWQSDVSRGTQRRNGGEP
jgi:hypothetical protein